MLEDYEFFRKSPDTFKNTEFHSKLLSEDMSNPSKKLIKKNLMKLIYSQIMDMANL